MSIANSTLHFHFPLVTGTDRPLFEDYNQTMETLDEKLYESISTLETIPQEITDLQTAVNGIAEQITALETFETEQTGTNQLVNNAILALQQAVAVIPTKFDSAGIADPYDADHGTYSVGDVVTYNGQRYVCSNAVTAAEPFDADKWTAVDVQTEIHAIKSALANVEALINPSDVVISTLLSDFEGAVVRRRIGDIFIINFNIYNPTNQITTTSINICGIGVNARDNCYGVLLSNDGKAATVSINGDSDILKIRAADTIGVNTYITGQLVVFI